MSEAIVVSPPKVTPLSDHAARSCIVIGDGDFTRSRLPRLCGTAMQKVVLTFRHGIEKYDFDARLLERVA